MLRAKTPELLILTGADAAYYRCLLQLLASIERVDRARSLRVIAYDLGLTARQRTRIARSFPRLELRHYELSAQPAFMRIRARALNSNAWKPQLIEAVLGECSEPLLWLDSASVLLRQPQRLVHWIRATGLYTPFGGHSSIARWTHESTARYLGFSVAELSPRMRASGVFGVDPQNARARALVRRWATLCREPACVAPAGALRSAHNFDQSVLNLLLLEARRTEPLALTCDELDISSDAPVSELRTRNKVHSALPMALDPLVRGYYAFYRALDVALLRLRRSRACPPPLRDVAEFATW